MFAGTARIVCGAVSMKRYAVRSSVRLSVPAWAHSSKPAAAAGLLLWARRAGYRLLQQRHANAGSATLLAYDHRLVSSGYKLAICQMRATVAVVQ